MGRMSAMWGGEARWGVGVSIRRDGGGEAAMSHAGAMYWFSSGFWCGATVISSTHSVGTRLWPHVHRLGTHKHSHPRRDHRRPSSTSSTSVNITRSAQVGPDHDLETGVVSGLRYQLDQVDRRCILGLEPRFPPGQCVRTQALLGRESPGRQATAHKLRDPCPPLFPCCSGHVTSWARGLPRIRRARGTRFVGRIHLKDLAGRARGRVRRAHPAHKFRSKSIWRQGLAAVRPAWRASAFVLGSHEVLPMFIDLSREISEIDRGRLKRLSFHSLQVLPPHRGVDGSVCVPAAGTAPDPVAAKSAAELRMLSLIEVDVRGDSATRRAFTRHRDRPCLAGDKQLFK